MIYDFNPIYGHLQECWTGCKSVKDHKILMRTAEIHLGELPSLPRAVSWGQEDVALPSSLLAVTGDGGWEVVLSWRKRWRQRRLAFQEHTGVRWAIASGAEWWQQQLCRPSSEDFHLRAGCRWNPWLQPPKGKQWVKSPSVLYDCLSVGQCFIKSLIFVGSSWGMQM